MATHSDPLAVAEKAWEGLAREDAKLGDWVYCDGDHTDLLKNNNVKWRKRFNKHYAIWLCGTLIGMVGMLVAGYLYHI